MKVYKNQNGQLVIDGDGITTIKMGNGINMSDFAKRFEVEVILTNFHFIGNNSNPEYTEIESQTVYIGEGGLWDGYLFVQDFIYVLGIKCEILSFAATPERELYDYLFLEPITDTKLIPIGTL